MLSTLDAIRARRSVWAYLPTEVPQETLRAVFELAQLSPSNCNTKPWIVHTVQGKTADALRQRLQAAVDPQQH